ncbi:MAG: antitoxin family protein [Acidobacteriota bacterium]
MTMHIEAVYERGLLRPLKPIGLTEGEHVELTLVSSPGLRLSRQERDARDIEIINRNADALNEEALDVLSYQVEL